MEPKYTHKVRYTSLPDPTPNPGDDYWKVFDDPYKASQMARYIAICRRHPEDDYSHISDIFATAQYIARAGTHSVPPDDTTLEYL